MTTRRRLALAGGVLMAALALARYLVPVILAVIALGLVVIECRAWLGAHARPIMVWLNGHPVHLLDAAVVEIGDQPVHLCRDDGGVSIDGVHVRVGSARAVGDVEVVVR